MNLQFYLKPCYYSIQAYENQSFESVFKQLEERFAIKVTKCTFVKNGCLICPCKKVSLLHSNFPIYVHQYHDMGLEWFETVQFSLQLDEQEAILVFPRNDLGHIPDCPNYGTKLIFKQSAYMRVLSEVFGFDVSTVILPYLGPCVTLSWTVSCNSDAPDITGILQSFEVSPMCELIAHKFSYLTVNNAMNEKIDLTFAVPTEKLITWTANAEWMLRTYYQSKSWNYDGPTVAFQVICR